MSGCAANRNEHRYCNGVAGIRRCVGGGGYLGENKSGYLNITTALWGLGAKIIILDQASPKGLCNRPPPLAIIIWPSQRINRMVSMKTSYY